MAGIIGGGVSDGNLVVARDGHTYGNLLGHCRFRGFGNANWGRKDPTANKSLQVQCELKLRPAALEGELHLVILASSMTTPAIHIYTASIEALEVSCSF